MYDEESFTSRKKRTLRAAQIARFAERQRLKRDWINFADIADFCAREAGSIVPDEKKRAVAFDTLAEALLRGEFDKNGRSQVLFLYGHTNKVRMTPEYLLNVFEVDVDGERGRAEFLPNCWTRREMVERWFEKRRLPKPPALLEPTTSGHRAMQPHGEEIEGSQGSDPPLSGDAPAQKEVPQRGPSAAIVPTMSLSDMHKLLPTFLKERSAKAQENGERFNQVIARSDAEAQFGRRIPRPEFRKIYGEVGVKGPAGRPRKSGPKISPKS